MAQQKDRGVMSGDRPEAFMFEAPKPTVSVNKDTRTVWIDGPIDQHMTRARTAIRDIAVERGKRGFSIVLVINSPGGAANGVFALMEEMDLIRSDFGMTFTGVVQGIAMSAGLILLEHCDRRIMGAWSTLMAHGVTYGIRGDIHDQETELALVYSMTNRISRLFARRTGRDAQDWYADFHSNRCIYYDAHDALAAHLVDEVIGQAA